MPAIPNPKILSTIKTKKMVKIPYKMRRRRNRDLRRGFHIGSN
jgi:hypothetical protein